MPGRRPSAQAIRKSAEKRPVAACERNHRVVKTPSAMSEEQRKRSQDSKDDISPPKKLLDSLSEKQKAERIKKARDLAVQNALISAYDNNKPEEAKVFYKITFNIWLFFFN